MRRFALTALVSSLLLLGAAPAPAPRATPAPLVPVNASPPPGPVHALPLIVVFPFDVSTDLKPQVGAQAASIFVQQMNGAGGVDAIDAPRTPRRQYLAYARKVSADYYVAGYMTPLAGGVSLVEQIVAVQGGVMVDGTTTQITSLADASSQAIATRDAIVQRETQLNAPIASSETQSTPHPQATNQANLSRLASGLFKGLSHGTSAPQARIVKPHKGVLVVRVSGSLAGGTLTEATNDLVRALNVHYHAALSSASNADVERQANAICGTHRDNTVATGTLTGKSVRRGLFDHTEYTFTMDVYACYGGRLAQTAGEATSIDGAVSAAVNGYAEAHPQNT